MDWYEKLIIFIGVLSLGYIGYLQILHYAKKQLIQNLESIIFEIKKIKPLINLKNKIYEMQFETDKLYKIKILCLNPNHEIIITNSNKVVINHDIKGWKRTSKVKFVKGITELIKESNNQETIKIVLIYPNCHNITKYINESDAFVVKKNQKIDGLYYVKFSDFKEFIENH